MEANWDLPEVELHTTPEHDHEFKVVEGGATHFASTLLTLRYVHILRTFTVKCKPPLSLVLVYLSNFRRFLGQFPILAKGTPYFFDESKAGEFTLYLCLLGSWAMRPMAQSLLTGASCVPAQPYPVELSELKLELFKTIPSTKQKLD